MVRKFGSVRSLYRDRTTELSELLLFMTNLPPVAVIADESLREQRIADIGQVSFAPCADFLLLCPCVPFFKRKPRAACGMKDAENCPLIRRKFWLAGFFRKLR